jgi:hypothetical protein
MYLASLLAANLDDAEVHHERAGWTSIGIHSPDASHFTRFNSIGLTPEITQFWQRKLALDIGSPKTIYAEASHLLFKAGLVEHLNLVPDDVSVDLIVLRRPEVDIAWSYFNRLEFSNPGYTWLWSLDPRYPNVIVDAARYREAEMEGAALWYVREVFARAEYYKRLVAALPNVTVHDYRLHDIAKPEGASNCLESLSCTVAGSLKPVSLPERLNATTQKWFGDNFRTKVVEVAQRIEFDPVAAGGGFFDSGRRLAHPAKP